MISRFRNNNIDQGSSQGLSV